MNRRRLLALASGVSTTTLAGCSTARSIVRSGPPYYEDVTLSGTDTVEVGEEFELTLSVKNTGGRTGTFQNTLTVGESGLSADIPVKIEDIPVAQTKSTTIGPIPADRASTTVFRITDYDARQEVTAETAEFSTDEELTLSDQSITVGPPSVQSAIDTGTDLGLTTEGLVYVFIPIETSASGDTTVPGPSDFSLRAGEPLQTPFTDEDKEPIIEGRYRPSDESTDASGDLIFGLSATNATEEIELIYDRGFGDTPEATWTAEGVNVPNLEIESVATPESTAWDEGVPVSVGVTNKGDKTGIFRQALVVDGPRGTAEAYIDGAVDAGETTRISATATASVPGTYTVTLEPMGQSRETDVGPASLSIGESIELPSGLIISVDNAVSGVEQYQYETSDGETNTAEAAEGETLLLADIAIENDSDEAIYIGSDLSASAGDTTLEQAFPPGTLFSDYRYLDPVSGPPLGSGTLESDASTDGVLMFSVPASVEATPRIVYEGLYRWAEWSL